MYSSYRLYDKVYTRLRLGHSRLGTLPMGRGWYMSRPMGKPTICICENKGADQLRSNCEADQRLCFRSSDSIIPLLLKFKISSFYLLSVTVQVGLCRTCSETTLLVFPRGGSYVHAVHADLFEDEMHVLLECTAYAEQRRDLEAKIFKLGYTQVTYDILLNPPSKHRQ